MNIKYLELKKITAMHGEEIQQAVRDVVESGWYLQGETVGRFESRYADYCRQRYCVTCANGLDALTLALRACREAGEMDDGDEIIVPANTYIATILAITENRLKAVLVEPDMKTFQIDDTAVEQAITSRTKAVMLVNLYGRNAYTDSIGALCERYRLRLMVDAAQSHGVYHIRETEDRYPWLMANATFLHSFYPGKNLGALGDGGALTTNDEALASMVRTLANYGSSRKYIFDYCGRNSRLDEIQAAVLDVKLRYLDEDNARRRDIALYYINKVKNKKLLLPSLEYWRESVFHIFPVLCEDRGALQQYLAQRGIQTVIHYPIPPHLQKCYTGGGGLVVPEGGLPVTERIHREELSIPCHQALTMDEVDDIVDALNGFL